MCCSDDVPGVSVPSAAAQLPGEHAGVPAATATVGPALGDARQCRLAATHLPLTPGQSPQVHIVNRSLDESSALSWPHSRLSHGTLSSCQALQGFYRIIIV